MGCCEYPLKMLLCPYRFFVFSWFRSHVLQFILYILFISSFVVKSLAVRFTFQKFSYFIKLVKYSRELEIRYLFVQTQCKCAHLYPVLDISMCIFHYVISFPIWILGTKWGYFFQFFLLAFYLDTQW